jgi:hypothetical protein
MYKNITPDIISKTLRILSESTTAHYACESYCLAAQADVEKQRNRQLANLAIDFQLAPSNMVEKLEGCSVAEIDSIHFAIATGLVSAVRFAQIPEPEGE